MITFKILFPGIEMTHWAQANALHAGGGGPGSAPVTYWCPTGGSSPQTIGVAPKPKKYKQNTKTLVLILFRTTSQESR